MTEEIFKLNVPDWQYLAFISGCCRCPAGEIDILALIYQDGPMKMKNRIRFPSGNRIIAERVLEKDEGISEMEIFILDMVKSFPLTYDHFITTIRNTSTKGQDLVNALHKSPYIETKITKEKTE